MQRHAGEVITVSDSPLPYQVRAARCPHNAPAEQVAETLERVVSPLGRSWRKLEAARTIALKVNIVWPPERIRSIDGRRQELVDDTVLRPLLRMLRERTSARLIVADTSFYPTGPDRWHDVHFLPLLEEFGVEFIDCNDPPFVDFEVPGGGLMFARYRLHQCLAEADELVSVATLKSHAFMGVTLCAKNLFGLCPIHEDNRPRSYFHHIIRLPYVLADLARILQPALNVVDGLAAQSLREWGGEGRIANTLLAGDHVIATDICGATLMGNDPFADWPTPPFRRDRNHIRCAFESGFGPSGLDEIDFAHDLTPPVAEFDSDATDSAERVANWRRSMCEQALWYRDHRAAIDVQYPGEYIYLQDGVVLFHGRDPVHGVSRRHLSGAKKDAAIWLKKVDPTDWEGERFDVYEQELARFAALV